MSTTTMPKFFKILIAIKLMVLVVAALLLTGHLEIGDINLFAQDDQKSPAANNQTASPSSATPASTDDGYVDAEAPKSSRKSFLDDLFSVPDINTESLQKDEVGQYLSMVESKKREVEERIGLLQAREQRLVDVENSIEEKLKRLEEEKRFFSDTLQKEKQLSDERLVQLVDFYKKMPPKAAVPVFEKLDKDLVVQLFNKLPQKQITTILSLMNPDISVKLTEYYGRLRSGKEYEMLREINKSLTTEFQNCKGM